MWSKYSACVPVAKRWRQATLRQYFMKSAFAFNGWRIRMLGAGRSPDRDASHGVCPPNVLAFSCERQQQQDRMLPRQQARGPRRTHRTMLGAKARARNGTTSTASTTRARQLQRPCWAASRGRSWSVLRPMNLEVESPTPRGRRRAAPSRHRTGPQTASGRSRPVRIHVTGYGAAPGCSQRTRTASSRTATGRSAIGRVYQIARLFNATAQGSDTNVEHFGETQ
jgi:hypothetical protein